MISARDEGELMFFLWEFLDKKVWESNEEEYAKSYFHWYTDGRMDHLLWFRTIWDLGDDEQSPQRKHPTHTQGHNKTKENQ